MVAGISILGIALGLGSQSLVKDVIQGMLIIAENQLRKGDIVKINGRAGLVEDLNLRRILVRDLDGALHIIPNGSTDIITNLTSQWSRVNIEIYVSYEEDLENSIKILNEIGSNIMNDADVGRFIKEKPKVFTITSFSDSGVKLKFVGVTLPGKQWDVRTKLIREINLPFLYCNSIGGQDELIFDGQSLAFSNNGILIGYGKAFEEDIVMVDLESEKKIDIVVQPREEKIYNALCLGLKDYFFKLMII